MSSNTGQHRVTLGASGLRVSPVCYGSWQLSPTFWGQVPQDDVKAAMRRAVEVGVNFFDTADAYGDGLSERVMGEALAGTARDQIVVATKVYWHFYPDGHRHPDLSRKYIVEECDASLRRLQMDYIDLYQCHSWDPLADISEIVDALEMLMKLGKIRAYGVSNWTVEQMRLGAAAGGRFTTLQPSYSLLNRGIESDLLPYCQAHRIGTLVYSPLHRGLLSGKYTGSETFEDARAKAPDFQGERFRTLCQKVSELRPIAEKYGLNIVQLVIAATLMHPGITCAIVGIKNPAQIEEAAGAMGHRIEREDWYAIRNLLSIPKV